MRFITTTNAPVICHNAVTGQLLWSVDVTFGAGRSLPIGMRDGKVYVMRLTESNDDSLFALDAVTGQRVWAVKPGVCTYIPSSASFAPNGDLIVDGSNFRLLRINHTNGAVVWSPTIIPIIVGMLEPVIFSNTIYVWENIGNAPNITAVDLTTGVRKYSKLIPDTYPGGPLQQMTPMVGNNGIIYAYKLGDNVTALQDNGTSLNILWTTPIVGNAAFSTMAEGPDSTIYVPSNGRVLRLAKSSGFIMDSTISMGSASLFTARISTGSDGKVYVTCGSTFLCATPNLETIFAESVPGLNTSGASIGPNGILAVAGGGSNLRVYKTNSVSVNNNNGTISGYELKQNYPNPFNPVTKINYSIPKSSLVILKVYNISGREIIVLVNEIKNSGNYSLDFDASDLASGAYFYKLEANGFSETKKMLLIK